MAMCYADGICTAKPKWRYSTIVSPGKRISHPPGRSEFHSDLKGLAGRARRRRIFLRWKLQAAAAQRLSTLDAFATVQAIKAEPANNSLSFGHFGRLRRVRMPCRKDKGYCTVPAGHPSLRQDGAVRRDRGRLAPRPACRSGRRRAI
jgi:hypothetical protein